MRNKILRNWVLENFPFLEDDIDSLTDYELFCRGFEYLNKKKVNKSDIPDINIFATKEDLSYYTKTDELSEVALTGKYVDLTGKPVVPNKTSQLINDSGFIDKDVNDLTYYTKSSDLSSVATSGSYDDLTNKPTIPDVSNFITKDVNDLTYYTKSSDLSSVATTGSYTDLINKPTIPTKTSDITNDSNFISATDVTWTALNNYVKYCRKSNIVFVEIMCDDGSYSIQGLTTIGVLPTGFIPSGRVDFDYHKISGSDSSSYAYINTSGEIKLGNNGNNEIKWFAGSISFPI